ncbi:hypothetical protein [Bartonella sp. AP58NXGY]|uniref:hypothetical protein n=1 Tax=Bartonella sp. AP58NXGY TaxID=3243498 RepID=UPI0035D123A0
MISKTGEIIVFKWMYSEEINTKASAEQIWVIWEDVEKWPSWAYYITIKSNILSKYKGI